MRGAGQVLHGRFFSQTGPCPRSRCQECNETWQRGPVGDRRHGNTVLHYGRSRMHPLLLHISDQRRSHASLAVGENRWSGLPLCGAKLAASNRLAASRCGFPRGGSPAFAPENFVPAHPPSLFPNIGPSVGACGFVRLCPAGIGRRAARAARRRRSASWLGLRQKNGRAQRAF